jgi:glycerol-1-phosphate dehydrogenase [NAD(P)+]
VAVATLTMARIQEAVLAAGPPRVHASSTTRADLEDRFGREIGESCWREFEPKRLTGETAPALAQRAAQVWDDLRDDVGGASIPATMLAAIIKRAGGPTEPADIGLSPAFYAEAVRNARLLRNRYTFLDLADESGHLARLWPA